MGARCGHFLLNARHPKARQEMLTCCPLFEKDRFQIRTVSGSHLTDSPWHRGLMWHGGHISVAWNCLIRNSVRLPTLHMLECQELEVDRKLENSNFERDLLQRRSL
jgi:hypothetical protein